MFSQLSIHAHGGGGGTPVLAGGTPELGTTSQTGLGYHLGQDRTGVPPPPRDRTAEPVLATQGRYASCGHAGRLSYFYELWLYRYLKRSI